MHLVPSRVRPIGYSLPIAPRMCGLKCGFKDLLSIFQCQLWNHQRGSSRSSWCHGYHDNRWVNGWPPGKSWALPLMAFWWTLVRGKSETCIFFFLQRAALVWLCWFVIECLLPLLKTKYIFRTQRFFEIWNFSQGGIWTRSPKGWVYNSRCLGVSEIWNLRPPELFPGLCRNSAVKQIGKELIEKAPWTLRTTAECLKNGLNRLISWRLIFIYIYIYM